MQDIQFTISNLVDNKLIVPNTVVGGFAVEDSIGQLVLVPQARIGTDVELDFTGLSVTGMWKIRFFRGEAGSNTTGGISSSEAMMYALLLG